MISSLFRLIKNKFNSILNNTLYIIDKNLTNQSLFFFFISVVSWIVIFNKIEKLQLGYLAETKKIEIIKYNETYMYLKNYISNHTFIVNNEFVNRKNETLVISDSIVNNKIDINLITEFIKNKTKNNTKISLPILESEWKLWNDFTKEPRNNLKNFLNCGSIKEVDENIFEINNNITILKKTKIKLFFCLGLLISSDIILKLLFC